MNRVILITGYPCTRKTTFGRQLRKAGWLHTDAETRCKTLLSAALEEHYGDAFVKLSKLHDKVVVTHGMPVRFMQQWIPTLQDLGVECYFITDETDESLKRWMIRELRQPEGSEKEQFDNLHALSNSELVRLFGADNVLRYDSPRLKMWQECLLDGKHWQSDRVTADLKLSELEAVKEKLGYRGRPPAPTAVYPTPDNTPDLAP
jgi:hypothetical protein